MDYKEIINKFDKITNSLSKPFCFACRKLKEYDDYFEQIGGISHHKYKRGLINHTFEVVNYCEELLKLKYNYKNPPNRDILITAALWHDLGKIWEYEWSDEGMGWIKSEKSVQLHHTYTSFAEFNRVASSEISLSDTDQIGHCIISHHYYAPQRNHPILPQSIEATLLCSSDHLSAMFGETK